MDGCIRRRIRMFIATVHQLNERSEWMQDIVVLARKPSTDLGWCHGFLQVQAIPWKQEDSLDVEGRKEGGQQRDGWDWLGGSSGEHITSKEWEE
ncbi:hypothetical protein MUK42_35597 [Musa troglodytarum]|uniref:Uncharacterized protein n=1 Tax=Musa troglodytarum TaxID=320322 RepID=A0A9E7H598_9LILI|nr:hypothetical protein MUK42_35597 [Musa troglodytarum]